jgi:Protein of unknown function DUF262
MWSTTHDETTGKLNDDQINAKYLKRELRIVTEVNREQLPNFVAALERPGWMDVKPFYQRRPRWDDVRQSRLIESFIMNIPIPPLFVYESDLAKYEVMDGQQRISAIRDFYSNKLKLKGLEQWPELNGRIYDTLPSAIKKGIDRRSISYFVLLKESATSTEDEILLRQQVFERLNTGGITLENQEIRNSIYHGKFTQMLLEAAKNPRFRKAWGVPEYTLEEDIKPSQALLSNSFWSQMRDTEVILRFFALRHAEHYRRGMAGFLDLYSVRARHFTDEDIGILLGLFEMTIDLAADVFGEYLFHPWDVATGSWSPRPQVAYADVVMVGFSRHTDQMERVRSRAPQILEATKELFAHHEDGTFTGRGNTKADVQQRISLFDDMLARELSD